MQKGAGDQQRDVVTITANICQTPQIATHVSAATLGHAFEKADPAQASRQYPLHIELQSCQSGSHQIYGNQIGYLAVPV